MNRLPVCVTQARQFFESIVAFVLLIAAPSLSIRFPVMSSEGSPPVNSLIPDCTSMV